MAKRPGPPAEPKHIHRFRRLLRDSTCANLAQALAGHVLPGDCPVLNFAHALTRKREMSARAPLLLFLDHSVLHAGRWVERDSIVFHEDRMVFCVVIIWPCIPGQQVAFPVEGFVNGSLPAQKVVYNCPAYLEVRVRSKLAACGSKCSAALHRPTYPHRSPLPSRSKKATKSASLIAWQSPERCACSRQQAAPERRHSVICVQAG